MKTGSKLTDVFSSSKDADGESKASNLHYSSLFLRGYRCRSYIKFILLLVFRPSPKSSLEDRTEATTIIGGRIWSAVSLWLAAPSLQPTTAAFLLGSRTSPFSKGFRSVSILVCLIVWKERNASVFQPKEKPLQLLIICEIKDNASLAFGR